MSSVIILKAQKRNAGTTAVQIPAKIAKQVGIQPGQYVEISVQDGFVVIGPHKLQVEEVAATK